MNQPVEEQCGTSVSNQGQGNVTVDEDYTISKEVFTKYVESHQKLLEHVKLLEDRNAELERLLRQARESIGGKDAQGNSVAIDLPKAEELLQQALCQIVPPMSDVLTTLRPMSNLDFLSGKECVPCSGTTTGLTDLGDPANGPGTGKQCCPIRNGVSPTKP